MLKNIYQHFNTEHFSPERYKLLLSEIHAVAGDTCLRMCETPVFVSRSFADEVVQGAAEIVRQGMALGSRLDQAVPPEFRIPSAPETPAFFIVDFAVTKEGPRLIEMQAFASNLAFIPAAAKVYKEVYKLGEGYRYHLPDRTEDEFVAALKKTILANHAPENVVLMEIDPWHQKSRRDFVVTQKLLGIPVVDVTEIIKEGNRLFYRDTEDKTVRIHRIYNRVIPTEFQSLHLSEKTPFRFTDALEVEWLNDPGWFLRISKYAMPFLDHPLVPQTRFLDQVGEYPVDLENYVLKPVFFSMGTGVMLNVTKADLDAVLLAERHRYILMRKAAFAPFIPDLQGNMLNAEIRVMLMQTEKLQPVALSARVMHGNDVNENLWGNDTWCGLTPVFVVDNG